MTEHDDAEHDDALGLVRRELALVLLVPVDQVPGDAMLIGLPNANSLRLLEAIGRIERETGVTVAEEALLGVRTVADVAALIRGKSAAE